MRSLFPLLVSTALVLCLPVSVASQTGPQPGPNQQPVEGSADQQDQPALLVADKIFITPDRKLIAEGNVEAFQGDVKLTARRITYDRETGELTLDGPIRIDQGGRSTVLADSAQLDGGFQNGLLSGARLVFDQQVQIASVQGHPLDRAVYAIQQGLGDLVPCLRQRQAAAMADPGAQGHP